MPITATGRGRWGRLDGPVKLFRMNDLSFLSHGARHILEAGVRLFGATELVQFCAILEAVPGTFWRPRKEGHVKKAT